VNFAALALRISKATERFPRFHKIARRSYRVFRPGIRFQTEAAFKHYQAIFVLKIGANDGVTNDPLATLLLTDRRYRGLLVEPLPMYAAMLRANYGECGRFAIEQAAVTASSRMRNKAARDSYHIRWLPTETVIGQGALGAILFLSQLPRIAKEAGDTEGGRS